MRVAFEHIPRGSAFLSLSSSAYYCMFFSVHRLTKHEQLVLCLAVGLLVLGWAVKVYRAAHAPVIAVEKTKP